MENDKCKNCGASIDISETACPYCGTRYPKKVLNESINENKNEGSLFVDEFGNVDHLEGNVSIGLNPFIFILLLFVFPPAAIIYLICKVKKKFDSMK